MEYTRRDFLLVAGADVSAGTDGAPPAFSSRILYRQIIPGSSPAPGNLARLAVTNLRAWSYAGPDAFLATFPTCVVLSRSLLDATESFKTVGRTRCSVNECYRRISNLWRLLPAANLCLHAVCEQRGRQCRQYRPSGSSERIGSCAHSGPLDVYRNLQKRWGTDFPQLDDGILRLFSKE